MPSALLVLIFYIVCFLSLLSMSNRCIVQDQHPHSTVADTTKNCVNVYIYIYTVNFNGVHIARCVLETRRCALFLIHARERERRNRLCIYECDERNKAKMSLCCITTKNFNFYWGKKLGKKRMIFRRISLHIKTLPNHLFISFRDAYLYSSSSVPTDK